MKKKSLLKKIVFVVLIIILLIPVLITVFGDRALKAAIETAASRILKVDVTLEDISLSLLSGSVELNNLIIPNLEGYENPNLLEAGNIKVDVDIRSLMSDTVKINKMVLNDITVTIEQKGLTTNNLQEILDSLPKDDKEKTDGKDKAEKNFLIKSLEMNNISVHIKLLPIPGKADTLKLNLTPIKMTDLGTKNKMSFAKLTTKILGAIAMGIAKDGADLIPKEMKEVLGFGAEIIIKSGEEVLKGASEVLKGAGEVLKGAGDAGKGLFDGAKGLFKKKEDE